MTVERDLTIESYLTLSKVGIQNTQKAAQKETESALGKKDPMSKTDLTYPQITWKIDEMYYDEFGLNLSGELFSGSEKLGYFSPNIRIPRIIIVDIIDREINLLEDLKKVVGVLK